MSDPYKKVRAYLAGARMKLWASTPLTDLARQQIETIEHQLDPEDTANYRGDAQAARAELEVIAPELARLRAPRPATAKGTDPLKQSPDMELLEGVADAIASLKQAVQTLDGLKPGST